MRTLRSTLSLARIETRTQLALLVGTLAGLLLLDGMTYLLAPGGGRLPFGLGVLTAAALAAASPIAAASIAGDSAWRRSLAALPLRPSQLAAAKVMLLTGLVLFVFGVLVSIEFVAAHLGDLDARELRRGLHEGDDAPVILGALLLGATIGCTAILRHGLGGLLGGGALTGGMWALGHLVLSRPPLDPAWHTSAIALLMAIDGLLGTHALAFIALGACLALPLRGASERRAALRIARSASALFAVPLLLGFVTTTIDAGPRAVADALADAPPHIDDPEATASDYQVSPDGSQVMIHVVGSGRWSRRSAYWLVELEEGAVRSRRPLDSLRSRALSWDSLLGWSQDGRRYFLIDHGVDGQDDGIIAVDLELDRAEVVSFEEIQEELAPSWPWYIPTEERKREDGPYARSRGARWEYYRTDAARWALDTTTGATLEHGSSGRLTFRDDWPLMEVVHAPLRKTRPEKNTWLLMGIGAEREVQLSTSLSWPRDLDGTRWLTKSYDHKRLVVLDEDWNPIAELRDLDAFEVKR